MLFSFNLRGKHLTPITGQGKDRNFALFNTSKMSRCRKRLHTLNPADIDVFVLWLRDPFKEHQKPISFFDFLQSLRAVENPAHIPVSRRLFDLFECFRLDVRKILLKIHFSLSFHGFRRFDGMLPLSLRLVVHFFGVE